MAEKKDAQVGAETGGATDAYKELGLEGLVREDVDFRDSLSKIHKKHTQKKGLSGGEGRRG